MYYYNPDAKKIESLAYVIDGCDCLPDVSQGRLSDLPDIWINGARYPQASTKEIDWWDTYIDRDTEATDLLRKCRDEGMTDGEERAILDSAGAEDMETQPMAVIQQCEIFLEKVAQKESVCH